MNEQNQIKVLCAQKQVVSYEAIRHWKTRKTGKRKDWQNLGQKIVQTGNVLQANSKSEGRIGKRLEGMLLPAGGKMTFFGGRIKRG